MKRQSKIFMPTYKEIIDSIKPDLLKATDFLQKKLSSIRTGRATPALVENIQVEIFGDKMPVKQLGAISILNAQQLLIQCWDASYMEPIQKAVLEHGSGIGCSVDKDGVKINLPPLSSDLRKELIKVLSQSEEEAKKVIRRFRDEAWSTLQKEQREGNIREDDKFKGKEGLQKLIDEYNKKIEDMIKNKQKELEE
jgi:ribosome recycling factor